MRGVFCEEAALRLRAGPGVVARSSGSLWSLGDRRTWRCRRCRFQDGLGDGLGLGLCVSITLAVAVELGVTRTVAAPSGAGTGAAGHPVAVSVVSNAQRAVREHGAVGALSPRVQ